MHETPEQNSRKIPVHGNTARRACQKYMEHVPQPDPVRFFSYGDITMVRRQCWSRGHVHHCWSRAVVINSDNLGDELSDHTEGTLLDGCGSHTSRSLHPYDRGVCKLAPTWTWEPWPAGFSDTQAAHCHLHQQNTNSDSYDVATQNGADVTSSDLPHDQCPPRSTEVQVLVKDMAGAIIIRTQVTAIVKALKDLISL